MCGQMWNRVQRNALDKCAELNTKVDAKQRCQNRVQSWMQSKGAELGTKLDAMQRH